MLFLNGEGNKSDLKIHQKYSWDSRMVSPVMQSVASGNDAKWRQKTKWIPFKFHCSF